MYNNTTTSVHEAYLSGDWTIAGVGQQVESLTESGIDTAARGATVAIDCSGIEGIDLSGFQMLFVWLHCMQLRGLKPELINIPDRMKAAQERLGVAKLFCNTVQERRLAA